MYYLDAPVALYPGLFKKMSDRVFSLLNAKTVQIQVVLDGKLPLVELSYDSTPAILIGPFNIFLSVRKMHGPLSGNYFFKGLYRLMVRGGLSA